MGKPKQAPANQVDKNTVASKVNTMQTLCVGNKTSWAIWVGMSKFGHSWTFVFSLSVFRAKTKEKYNINQSSLCSVPDQTC